jgi:hypothetical protein
VRLRELSIRSNEKISRQLEKLVRHGLEKKPELRFQSARDLTFALEAVSTPGSAGILPASGASWKLALSGHWRDYRPWMIAAGLMMMVKIQGATGDAPQASFKKRMLRDQAQTFIAFDVTADGQRFLIHTKVSAPSPVSVILNWTEGLKR